MALCVDEDVLRLQVPVGDALALVQELEDQHDFGGVELRRRFVETARPAQVAEDFAAGAVVELSDVSGLSARPCRQTAAYHHVERVQRLEARHHGRDEGVPRDLGEHVALVADVLDLLEADDIRLAQDLEGKDLVGVAALDVFKAHQPHARKGAGAQRLDQLKVLLAQHLGRVADGLRLRVALDLVGAQGVLLVLPLRQRVLLFLARAVHGRVVAVVQRAGVVLGLRAILLVAQVLARMQQAVHRRRHACSIGRARGAGRSGRGEGVSAPVSGHGTGSDCGAIGGGRGVFGRANVTACDGSMQPPRGSWGRCWI
jgi:hypothetical protein